MLGDGCDRCELAAAGFDEVDALVNTGPAGGQDTVVVNLVHHPIRGLKCAIDHIFDDGLDHLSLRAEGYEEVLFTPNSSDEREFGIIARASPHS